MALNFPLSPEDGDTYENYVYDATEGVWNANPQQLASRFITSATQPSTPSNGDGWLDTNTGKTYIYYNDGSSAQWIESGNPVIGFVDPYDQDSTSTGYFSLPKGTSAQRPVAPSNGDIRFNTELGEPEYYSEAESSWFLFRQEATREFEIQYLVLAGGGGGGNAGGAGGAGGYRCNVSGENSGGGASAEGPLTLDLGTYTVTVGAGGAGATTQAGVPGTGANSVFGSITSAGGGRGGVGSPGPAVGGDGGSGGGGNGIAITAEVGGSGTSGQGFGGGNGNNSGTQSSGGGGGAGQAGANGASSVGGNGGNGVASSITGLSVTRGGGGGGSIRQVTSTNGTGGAGGGGNGGNVTAGGNGGTNLGGGAGAGGIATSGAPIPGGNGGSGVVILKMPSSISPTFSVGLTEANGGSGQPLGDFRVYTITAGTGTVTFS